MNAIRYTLYAILIPLLLTVLLYGLIFAAEKLEVQGDLEIQSTDSGTTPSVPLRHGLIFKPLYTTTVPPTAPPQPGTPGQIYYNGDEKGFLYRNNTTWVEMGAGAAAQDKYVATRIVAAYDSLGSTRDGTNPCLGDGSACNNPKADYTCNGVNDREQINLAITDLPASGGAVYLLEGFYRISRASGSYPNTVGIMLNRDNVALIGTGAGTLLGHRIPDPDYTIGVSGNNTFISQLRLSGGIVNKGILLDGYYSKIDKVWFQFRAAIKLTGSKNVVSDCSFSDMQGVDKAIDISGSDNTIYNNAVSDVTLLGINVEGANNTIEGNNFRQGDKVGSDAPFMFVFGQQANSNLINANNFSVTAGGILISADKLAAQPGPSGNIITNNNFDDCYVGPYQSSLPLPTFDSCRSSGVVTLCSAESNIVSSNLFSLGNIVLGATEDATNYTKNNLISGNMIYNSVATSGIRFQGNAKENQISFNHISNTIKENTGIEGLSGAKDTYILGNYIDHYTVETILKSDNTCTGIKYTQREKITLERSTQVLSPAPNNLIIPHAPTNYIAVKSSGGAVEALFGEPGAPEETTGDILILEGRDDTDFVQIYSWDLISHPESFVKLPAGVSVRDLKKNDILKLIWDGVYWVEVSYSDNKP